MTCTARHEDRIDRKTETETETEREEEKGRGRGIYNKRVCMVTIQKLRMGGCVGGQRQGGEREHDHNLSDLRLCSITVKLYIYISISLSEGTPQVCVTFPLCLHRSSPLKSQSK